MELLFKTWLLEESSISDELKKPEISGQQGYKLVKNNIDRLVNNNFGMLRQDMRQGIRNLFRYWSIKPYLPELKITPADSSGILRLVSQWISNYRDFIVKECQNNWSSFRQKINNKDYSPEKLNEENETWHALLQQEEDQKRPKGPEGELVPLSGMPEGYYWVSLNKGYCEKEGKAMGHCGNVGEVPGDNIFSLRNKDGKAYLTFIVNDQRLGESKGVNNSKPAAKFHPHILALLLGNWKGKPIVENIKGGGYAPENNFKISDLSPAYREILSKKKPYLENYLKFILDLATTDKNLANKKMKEFLDPGKYRFDTIEIDIENGRVILNKGGADFFRFYEYLGRKYDNEYALLSLDEIEEKIQTDSFESLDFSEESMIEKIKSNANQKNEDLLLKIANEIDFENFDDKWEILEQESALFDIFKIAIERGFEEGIWNSIKSYFIGNYSYGIEIFEKNNKFFLSIKSESLNKIQFEDDFQENGLGPYYKFNNLTEEDLYMMIQAASIDKKSLNETLEDELQGFIEILKSTK